MKDILVVFLLAINGLAADHTVHLIPAHIICPEVPLDHDILIPDPNDCTVFYKCADGFPVPQNCPQGLAWCQQLSKCTLPILANCTIGHQPVTYSPEDLERLCPENGVTLPNPADCNSYYKCINNTETTRECPRDTEYSCWIGECITKEVANCLADKQQDGQPCSKNGEQMQNPQDCNSYYECVDGYVERKQCKNENVYSKWYRTCVQPTYAQCETYPPLTKPTDLPNSTPTLSQADNICPIEGAVLPDPLNCTNYYICVKETPTLQECPDNLAYSCWAGECVSPVIAMCFKDSATEGLNCTNEGTKLSNLEDCSSYYACVNGTTKKINCQSGSEYNQWYYKCVEPRMSHCTPATLPTSTQTLEPPQTIPPSATDNICPFNGILLPDHKNCSMYYKCINNKPVHQTCKPNFAYSCWDHKCLPAEAANCLGKNNQVGQPCEYDGDTLANVDDCSNYYVCKNKTVVEIKCSADLEYNEWYHECYNSTYAHCSVIPSTSSTGPTTPTDTPPNECPVNGVQWPDPLNCNSYYKCSNNKISHKYCPKDKEYSCWVGECMDPEVSNCLIEIDQDGQNCAVNGERLLNPQDCHSYYECVDGHVKTINCEYDKEYNQWSGICENTSIAECKTYPTVTPTPVITSPTPVPTLDNICPIEGAVLPDPLNCSNYYVCVNQTPILKTCPDNLAYSCWDGKCESPVIAQCFGDTTVNLTCTNEGLQLSNTQDCNSYYACVNGTTTIINCNSELEYNQWYYYCVEANLSHCVEQSITTRITTTDTSETTPSPVNVACPTDGALLPAHNQCNKYYECVKNTPVQQTCEGNLLYSSWDEKCLPPETANCINEHNQEGQPCNNDEVALPNLYNCESYYKCTNNKATEYNCPLGLEYNQWYKTCINSSYAHCSEIPLPPTTTSTTTSISSNICPDGFQLPNPLNCSSYYVCSNNEAILTYCPKNSEYSCWIGACIEPELSNCLNEMDQNGQQCAVNGKRLPDPQNCQKYYECVNGFVQTKQCDDDTKYNQWYQKCESALTAKCHTYTPITQTTTPIPITPEPSPTDNICPIDDAVQPDPMDCNNYYICVNQTPTLDVCPDNLAYSCWDGECVSPVIAMCFEDNAVEGLHCTNIGKKLSNPRDCSSYFECVNGTTKKIYCTSGLEYNQWYTECRKPNLSHCTIVPFLPTTSTERQTPITPSATDNICPFNGILLPDHKNCSMYYKCINNKPVHQTCKPNFAYSCWDHKCLPAEAANCLGKNNQVGQPCEYDGDTLANVDDCSNYYVCKNKTVVEIKCSADLEYNEWYHECYNSTYAHCSVIPSTSSTGPTTPTDTPPNECPVNGVQWPDPLNCNSYYKCSNNKISHKYCPKDKEYSCWVGECMDPEVSNCLIEIDQDGQNCAVNGERLLNPQDCHSYYECVDGHVKTINCEYDKEYNQWSGICENTSIAECKTYPTVTPTPVITSPTPVPTLDNICPIEGAVLPDPLNCSNYYVCVNQTPILKTCPDNLAYSCWDGKCESPVIAQCFGDTTVNLTCTNEGLQLSNTQDCNSYYACVNGTTTIINCNSELEYNQWYYYCVEANLSHCVEQSITTRITTTDTSETTPSPVNVACPTDGALLPAHNQCNKYYECVKNTPVQQTCEGNLLYSSWDEKCLPPETANCINEHNQEGQPCNNDEVALPNLYNCESYYKCTNNKATEYNCPLGLEYNQWYKTCINSSYAHCSEIPLPPTTTSTTTSISSNICPDGFQLPNPLNCSSYYVCSNNEAILTYCPKNSEYSCWIGACIEPELSNCLNEMDQNGQQCAVNGKRLPDPQNCQKYYECVNGFVQTKQCDDDTKYNQWYQKCESALTAKCHTYTPITQTTTPIPITPEPSPTDNICPIDDAVQPDPMDCNNYYICVNQTPTLDVCPDNLAYSCWDGECVSPVIAMCFEDNAVEGLHCTNIGKKLSNPRDCSSYFECVNGTTKKIYCTSGLEYNQWYTECRKPNLSHCTIVPFLPTTSTERQTFITPSATDNICPFNGILLPDHKNCSMYYKCINNKPVHQTCKPNFVYSCWDHKCLPAEAANCLGKNNQVGQPCEYDGDTLANVDDCSSYYECKNKKVIEVKCSDGLEYNEWYNRCYDPEYSHCTSSITPTPTVSSSTPAISESENICPVDHIILPDVTNCTGFFICTNNKPFQYHCPTPLVFNAWDCECQKPGAPTCIIDTQVGETCRKPGDLLPVSDDCNCYYECVDGFIKRVCCSEFLEYNMWYKKCVQKEFSHCSTTSPISTFIPTPTDILTPSSSKDICPESGGFLPNPSNCSTYYKCINGSPTIQNCAEGLQYSCWDQKCLPPSEANCIAVGSQTGQKCSLNGQQIFNPENCHTYYQCNKGIVVTKYCRSGLEYNKWFGFCFMPILSHCRTYTKVTPTPIQPTPPISSTNDICPINGALLPNLKDCATYYICTNHTAVIKSCPKGEKYSFWDQTCMPKSKAKCFTKEISEKQKCSANGARLPNPKSCNSYYECDNDQVVQRYCLLLTEYNKWYEKCELTIYSHCEYSTNISYPEIFNDVCPDDGDLVPDPLNCSAYYKCVNNKPVLQNCSKNKKYSAWDGKCKSSKNYECINDGPWNGKSCKKNGKQMMNPEDCSQYYECQDGKIKTSYCFFGYQYNKWFKNCYLPPYSHCHAVKSTESHTPSLTPTPEPPTTVVCPKNDAKVANPTDCTSYFECKNKKPQIKYCSKGKAFDCWDLSCKANRTARCVNAKGSPVGGSCPKDGNTIPKVSDCNRYYKCVDGKIEEKRCSIITQYSTWSNGCVLIGFAKCAKN